jgi:diguanylate cyclase (GGDEF)-like protein
MSAVIENSVFLENNPKLATRLTQCGNLPTPPGLAMQIIDLGNDPGTDMSRVADVVSLDPALTTKIFRVANSALYARQRKTENLRQAIILFGLNGVLTLALSFSLTNSLRAKQGKGLDYNRFWRRSLAMALTCRALGRHVKGASKEDLFMAGLLQDIGMMVIDKLEPHIYGNLTDVQADHGQIQQIERQALGVDHAELGAWLLNDWNLPPQIVQAVAASHNEHVMDIEHEHAQLLKCAAVAGKLADIWVGGDPEKVSLQGLELAEKLLQINAIELAEIIAGVSAEFEEHAALFEIDLGDDALMSSISDRAQEAVMLRTLKSMQHADELHKSAAILEDRTRNLEEQALRDGLTGLYNRRYLDRVLGEEFDNAKRHGWPLAVLFVDLDRFKRINDEYGHPAGDKVLKRAAQILIANSRDSDVVARYGGEEFVLLLPGTNETGAEFTCERIIKAFRDNAHAISNDKSVMLTASIGAAIQGKHSDFDHCNELVEAADKQVYNAKRQGRDRWLMLDSSSA